MSRGYNFCNNCGENGHAFHQCKKPIIPSVVEIARYQTYLDLVLHWVCVHIHLFDDCGGVWCDVQDPCSLLHLPRKPQVLKTV